MLAFSTPIFVRSLCHMALILPLISFLIGYLGVKKLQALRSIFAALLAKIMIPLVIVYHMVFYQVGSLWLIGFSFLSSILFFSFFYYVQKNKLRALCLSYLNGAWLGFPFALAIFGPEASSTIVALYIGGSLFGNICAVMVICEHKQSLQTRFKNVMLSPPVVALSLAALLSIWDLHALEHHVVVHLMYQINKVLVTFTGMCILGMWLSHVRIDLHDLKRSLWLISSRILIALVLCVMAYFCLPIPQYIFTYAVILMFFCLPPAANIVALETHYQGTGHSAKYIASGTIASAILIGLYAIFLHAIGFLN